MNFIITVSLFPTFLMLPAVSCFNYNSPYITYSQGDCALVFSAPHGGSQQPATISDRTVCSTSDKPYRGCHLSSGECDFAHHADHTQQFCKCNESPEDKTCEVKHLKDSYTKEIATGVRQEIQSLVGVTPYIIINELKRNKMDGNRDKAEATFGEPEAETAWETYHERIDHAIHIINQPAVVLDFHGQTHSEGWTELGYTLSKSQLLSSTPDPVDSTICNLTHTRCASYSHSNCFEEILRGRHSLGWFLEDEVDENEVPYSVVPSPSHPDPGISGNYFSGGFNVKRHGSEDCDGTYRSSDAIQIEMPSKQRKESTPRMFYIKALGKAIVKFMDQNYPGWR